MYKLERKVPSSGSWYETMLSPFKTREEAIASYKKYSPYYPKEHRVFRITNLETGGKKVLR